ncbi:TlpA family protein disulfide reductase [Neolewinella antarctica]|uniref:Peroxiredoxin n=1 Tax=Neolewinella antarctica TaxID=442734 RepID=A0ABX0XCU2_9BACT|nr:TlpA disulfide reductase family protein [Neolewinella antarctica]NJC27099.1 peroxiredoxin [Neolewinella antarctica]
MKSLLVTTLLLLSAYVAGQTKINGHFESAEGWSREVYLLAITDYNSVFASTERYNIDTTSLDSNGNFEFSLGELPCTDCLYRIDVRPADAEGAFIYGGTSKENYALFELQNNGSYYLTGSVSNLTKSFSINGGDASWSYEEIRKIREPVYAVGDEVNAKFTDEEYLRGKDIDSLQSVFLGKLEAVINDNNKLLADFIDRSANIYDRTIGLSVYDYDQSADNDIEYYEEVFNGIDSTYVNHPYYRQLAEKINEVKYVLPVGSVAPDLRIIDSEGKMVSLDSTGKNLVLVDFWASWCSPCRYENREFVKPLYDRFKDAGFEVFSVSLDKSRDQWLKAIEKDKMTWINVSDLLGTDSPVYTTYKIESIPTTYLIDKEGMDILAKNIRGEELVKFVEQYYKK